MNEKNEFEMANFRDVAKFSPKIKQNKIFRASTLTNYQASSFFADFIQKHQINTIVDLRTEDEYTQNPYQERSLKLFQHKFLPIDPSNQSSEFIAKYHFGSNNEIAYRHFAYGHQFVFKAFFEEIDPAKDIILVHCHWGKDRTGAVIALILWLIGEDFEHIWRDYLASEMDTSTELLRAFLEIIHELGGVESYLLSCKIAPERLSYWKTHLQRN